MIDAITASAAIAAAIFSVVNVLVSTRSARGIEDRKWRRETARRSMHEFLSTIDSLHQSWLDASVSLEVESRDKKPVLHRALDLFAEEVGSLCREPRRHLVELELVATPRCVKASQNLFDAMNKKEFNAIVKLAKIPDTDGVDLFRQWMARTEQLRQEFITACRVDLGAGRRVRAQSWRYGGWLR